MDNDTFALGFRMQFIDNRGFLDMNFVRVSSLVLMASVFQFGNCHNAATEKGLLELLGRGQRSSMMPVAAPRQQQARQPVQPDVNISIGSVSALSRGGNGDLSSSVRDDSQGVAQGYIRGNADLYNNDPAHTNTYGYSASYGYNWVNDVASTSDSQRVPTDSADKFIRDLGEARAAQQKEDEELNRVAMETHYQVVYGLVNKAKEDLIDFLDGKKNENVDDLLSRGRSREEVADILEKILIREMIGLEKMGAGLKGVSQEVKAKREEVDGLLARLHLPESVSIDKKVVGVSRDIFQTNSPVAFVEDAKKSFTREDKGGRYPSLNGTLYDGQCAINSLCLSSEEERKIPDEIRKELNDRGGIQPDAKELWERIADSVQKRIFVYEYQNGSIVSFFEYGRSYDDLRRVCGEFKYDAHFKVVDAHYQRLK